MFSPRQKANVTGKISLLVWETCLLVNYLTPFATTQSTNMKSHTCLASLFTIPFLPVIFPGEMQNTLGIESLLNLMYHFSFLAFVYFMLTNKLTMTTNSFD